jgi:hypothetical protein
MRRTIFDASGFDDMEGITWLLQRYLEYNHPWLILNVFFSFSSSLIRTSTQLDRFVNIFGNVLQTVFLKI